MSEAAIYFDWGWSEVQVDFVVNNFAQSHYGDLAVFGFMEGAD